MTAQIAIGHGDMYHGGIIPTHALWLSENSRPAWILDPVWRTHSPTMFEGDELPPWTEERVVWVPSGPEDILEDGLLMIATHVVHDPKVLELIQAEMPDLEAEDWFDLTTLPAEQVKRLRTLFRDTERDFKLIVTVGEGSSLLAQLPALAHYSVEVEVCTVSYSRLRRGMGGSGELEARGSLEPPPDADHRYYAVNFT